MQSDCVINGRKFFVRRIVVDFVKPIGNTIKLKFMFMYCTEAELKLCGDRQQKHHCVIKADSTM